MIKKDIVDTKHAPAERIEAELIISDTEKFESLGLLVYILDSLPDFIMILNEFRQVVYLNTALMEKIGNLDKNHYYGKRVGEIFDCQHSSEQAAGCGTSEACRQCGAVNAILSAQRGISDIQECRIVQKEEVKAFDLKVYASPLRLFEGDFVVYAMTDIADEKRRKVLERIFFHDIMNTAGGVRGLAGIMREAEPDEMNEFVEMLDQVSEKLIDEIKSQRELSAAETNELVVVPENVSSFAMLEAGKSIYTKHIVSRGKTITIDTAAEDVIVKTDKTLLGRVLGNLIKNALEASPKWATVTINSFVDGNRVKFTVKNEAVIPRHIQLQMFQRSFSTKGPGRGIGTYSIKLLTEKYLKGKVSFESEAILGTVFTVEIPLEIS